MDLEALRADTPALAASCYLNSASNGLMARQTIAALQAHVAREGEIGSNAAASEASDEIEDGYAAAAGLLGCGPDEIAFVEGHSRGWQSVVGALSFAPGDRILVGRSEWGGNYAAFLQLARRSGVSIEAVPCEASGEISVTALADMIEAREATGPVRLISLTWVGANGGLVHPAAEVGALARAAGIPFVLDASQALGQLPADVDELGCDVLTAPGRKWLRGPRGTGILYVRRAFLDGLEPVLLDHMSGPLEQDGYRLRPGARRFEASSSSITGRLGLRTAIRQAQGLGLDRIRDRIDALATRLRQRLAALPGVVVRDLGVARCGLVSFTVEGWNSSKVAAALLQLGIEVSANGPAFTPLDMRARHLEGVVRASVHYYNRVDEIERLADALTGLVRRGPG